MINHAWRELTSRLGWRMQGRFATLVFGAITFIAVVVAWVFFRADSFTTAYSMLGSMFGAHQLMPKSWVPSREALKVIIPCLMLAWTFPNVRQMMIAYKPTCEDVEGVKTPAALVRGRLTDWLYWKPGRARALGMAILFLWCLDSLTKVSEFLYFRF